MVSRFSDDRIHNVVKNIGSRFFCPCDRFTDNLVCKSVDLDIHLDGCDSLIGSCHLKVHVSEKVFQTLDVGEDQIIIVAVSCHQSYRNTGYRRFDRHTCCHQRQRRCTDASLGCGTIGFHDLRYGTDRIRELFFCRKHRYQCTFCQRSMSDLSSSRTSARSGLSYGIGRKIIVVHVALARLVLIHAVQSLRF